VSRPRSDQLALVERIAVVLSDDPDATAIRVDLRVGPSVMATLSESAGPPVLYEIA
jgi:hypothetical protein